jgi:DeoR family fructose operon transcriptional repressor
MARAAQRTVVLADSSKLGREHLVRFAAVADVDVLVTDADADPQTVADLQNAGIEVVVA